MKLRLIPRSDAVTLDKKPKINYHLEIKGNDEELINISIYLYNNIIYFNI